MKTKTISAHIGATVESELKHQNREIMCNNVDYTRSKNNKHFVYSGGINSAGEYNLSLEESYNLIFDKFFEEFKKNQRPCRRSEAKCYLEHIRLQKEREKSNGKKHKSKTVNELYTAIIQVGNKDDTGFESNPGDFEKARVILEKIAKEILELPYVVVLNSENVNDFKPPDLDAYIVIQNLNTHVDEASCHLNLSFFCVFNNKNNRGQKVCNNAKKCWESIGFPTEYAETDEVKKDKNGNDVFDEKGEPVYKKRLVKKGVLDWLEFIKSDIIEPEMKKYDWQREEKLEGNFNHLTIQEYKLKKHKEELLELNKAINENEIEKAIKEVDSTLAFYNAEKHYSENFKNNTDRTKEFEAYNAISTEFWSWYKNEKNIVLDELQKLKDEEKYMQLKIRHYNNLIVHSSSLLTKMFNFIFKHFYLMKKKQYDLQIQELIKNRDELKRISKEFSSGSYNIRNDLKDKTKNPNVELMNALKVLEKMLIDDYEKFLEKEYRIKEK